MTIWNHVASVLSAETHLPFELQSKTRIGGGSINEMYLLAGRTGVRYFLKLNDAQQYPMFVAEAAGLEAIAATKSLRVPQPIAHGSAREKSYLILEYLELCSLGDSRLLGEQLAALHRCSADRFGFAQDNYIGTTLQPNGWTEDWMRFWRDQRLGYQLQLAIGNGYGARLQDPGKKLLDALPAFFDGYVPQPSLLHGDLWSGNHAYLADGTPTLFDPAPYYGDRECDLAMTELFGGFHANFYTAYRAVWPLDAGYIHRRDLYNLYHVLNHANLFGGGYVSQAAESMQRLLVKCI